MQILLDIDYSSQYIFPFSFPILLFDRKVMRFNREKNRLIQRKKDSTKSGLQNEKIFMNVRWWVLYNFQYLVRKKSDKKTIFGKFHSRVVVCNKKLVQNNFRKSKVLSVLQGPSPNPSPVKIQVRYFTILL